MQDTLSRYLAAVAGGSTRNALRPVLTELCDNTSSVVLSSAGLVITATSGKYVPKIGAADCYAIASGVLVKIAAGTDMPALSGVITAGKYNVFAFFVDSAGTVTSAMGTEGAAIGNVVFPPIPQGKAMLGFIIVTYASTFTGGSVALDTATTVYISPLTSFDPTVLI